MDDDPWRGHVFGRDLEADRKLQEDVRLARLRKAEAASQALLAQTKAFLPLVSALRDGDLQPLAAHLRSGAALPQHVSDEIAQMIEGEGFFFNIEAVGRQPGQRGWSTDLLTQRRRMEIGVHAEARAQILGKGKSKIAIGETMDKFAVSEATVHACRKDVKERLARMSAENRKSAWAVWKDVYSNHNG